MKNIKNQQNKWSYMVWHSDRHTIRLFVGVTSILWAIVEVWALLFSIPPGVSPGHEFFVQHARHDLFTPFIWPVLFAIQGISAIWAVMFDKRWLILLFLDSILGCLLWGGIAVLTIIGFNSALISSTHLSLTVAMFAITLWLTMRSDYGH